MNTTNNTNANNNVTLTDMTPEQLEARAQELQRQIKAIGKICPDAVKYKTVREVKVGEKGGLFIKDPNFKEKSAKGKTYIAGINMGKNTAAALFLNPEFLEEVVEFVEEWTTEEEQLTA